MRRGRQEDGEAGGGGARGGQEELLNPDHLLQQPRAKLLLDVFESNFIAHFVAVTGQRFHIAMH